MTTRHGLHAYRTATSRLRQSSRDDDDRCRHLSNGRVNAGAMAAQRQSHGGARHGLLWATGQPACRGLDRGRRAVAQCCSSRDARGNPGRALRLVVIALLNCLFVADRETTDLVRPQVMSTCVRRLRIDDWLVADEPTALPVHTVSLVARSAISFL